jgi:hypothetical protein
MSPLKRAPSVARFSLAGRGGGGSARHGASSPGYVHRYASANDLTTLNLDHTAFIDAVVELIDRHEADPEAAHSITLTCKARWGTTA